MLYDVEGTVVNNLYRSSLNKNETRSMFDTYSKNAGRSNEQKIDSDMQSKRNSKIPLSECTDFTLHVSQKSEFAMSKCKFIDYTEHRLHRYIETIVDKQQELVLMTMLSDYLRGNIAIAWRRGQPVYVKVMKE